jgi:hypothetical protein
MRIAPREKASIEGLVLADYRPGDSLAPTTPLQQVAQHVAGQLGLARLDTRRLVLSVVDGVDLERRTRAFVEAFAPRDDGTLSKMWTKESSPAVSLALAAGEVAVLPATRAEVHVE